MCYWCLLCTWIDVRCLMAELVLHLFTRTALDRSLKWHTHTHISRWRIIFRCIIVFRVGHAFVKCLHQAIREQTVHYWSMCSGHVDRLTRVAFNLLDCSKYLYLVGVRVFISLGHQILNRLYAYHWACCGMQCQHGFCSLIPRTQLVSLRAHEGMIWRVGWYPMASTIK